MRGKHECYYCGEQLNWEVRINPPSGVPFIMKGQHADAIAIGNQDSMTGKETIFEIHANCSQCKVRNKFEYIKKSR